MMKRPVLIFLLALLTTVPSLSVLAIPAGYGVVRFKINVRDCLVYIAGKTIEGGRGEASICLREGSYDYKITSDKYYHSLTGTLLVASGEETTVNAALRPAFGSISVDSDSMPDLEGALVFVDGVKSGNIPCRISKLSGGRRSIRIIKKNYLPAEFSLDIAEGKEEHLSPVLTANYSVVRIATADGAEIWANSENLGLGKWTGKMEAGVYHLESRRSYFASGSLDVEIKAGSDTTDLILPAPLPQYGSMKIEFSPSLISSEVFLDDNMVGIVPLLLDKVQAGHHSIRLEKKSSGTVRKYKCEVDVLPGQMATISEGQFIVY